MNQEIIQFIGVKELEKPEADIVRKLATEYHDKIKISLNNLTSLVVHIKQYSKGGKQRKYSIHLRAIAPTRIFESTESDWDLAKTLHSAFKDIERQIEHSFKTDDQR